MIPVPTAPKIWLAAGVTDLRKGFVSQSVVVVNKLSEVLYGGHLLAFRGRRGDLVKIIWYDGQRACLYTMRMECGRFVWPAAKNGKIYLTQAQPSVLLEGIDRRMPVRTRRPITVG